MLFGVLVLLLCACSQFCLDLISCLPMVYLFHFPMLYFASVVFLCFIWFLWIIVVYFLICKFSATVTVMLTDKQDVGGDIGQCLSHAACPDTDRAKLQG